MAEDNKIETTETEVKSRRKFVTTAAQVAVTAPAVGLLLSAATKPAAAQVNSLYVAKINHILDDYTTGNDHEDIDAANLHTSRQDDIFHPAASGDDGSDDTHGSFITPA